MTFSFIGCFDKGNNKNISKHVDNSPKVSAGILSNMKNKTDPTIIIKIIFFNFFCGGGHMGT